MSVSVENFVKTIYELRVDDRQKAITSKMAEKLLVSSAAITDMARKLHGQGLVIYEKYKEIALTENGMNMAISVIRKHRLWESFLVEVLSISWDKVHNEAEQLEHETSDFLIGEIEKFLDYPQFNPHGDPIPNAGLIMPEPEATLLLNECAEPGSYMVARIQHKVDELSSFFARNKIGPNKQINLIGPIGKTYIIIEINNKEIVLTNEIASQIRVRKI